MGSKGEKHISRLAMPKTWQIKKKGIKYVTKPLPGAHSLNTGIPINIVFRDILKYTKTNREVKNILNNQEVFADGIRRRNPRFIIGLMDTLSIPKIEKYFRVLLNKKNKLILFPIKSAESAIKPCKIIGKKSLKKKIQLNLYDGKNILVEKTDYKVGDTLLIELPSQKIKDHMPLKKGANVYLTGGKHTGEVGIIDDISVDKIRYKQDKSVFETSKDYAFVIGKEKPMISLPKEISEQSSEMSETKNVSEHLRSGKAPSKSLSNKFEKK